VAVLAAVALPGCSDDGAPTSTREVGYPDLRRKLTRIYARFDAAVAERRGEAACKFLSAEGRETIVNLRKGGPPAEPPSEVSCVGLVDGGEIESGNDIASVDFVLRDRAETLLCCTPTGHVFWMRTDGGWKIAGFAVFDG
jgi:hypothetical protein